MNTNLLIIAGAAGVGWYLYSEHQKQQLLAQPIYGQQPVQSTNPFNAVLNLVGTVVGSVLKPGGTPTTKTGATQVRQQLAPPPASQIDLQSGDPFRQGDASMLEGLGSLGGCSLGTLGGCGRYGSLG